MKELPLSYDSCIETLKETSWDDDNDIYVSSSDLEVYNFDKVKKKYYEDSNLDKGVMIASCDALYIHNETEIYLIEFRNAALSILAEGTKKREIKDKNIDSLFIYQDIVCCGISQTRENVHFILVYDDAKTEIRNKQRVRSGQKIKELDLSKYEGICYKRCLKVQINFDKTAVTNGKLVGQQRFEGM